MEDTQKPTHDYTPEQILEMEKKMQDFYEKKLPFLRVKAEHDRLVADISEDRIRNLKAMAEFNYIQDQQAKSLEKQNNEVKPTTDGSNTN